MDDLGRLRRFLRRADDEPRFHRLRRPVGLRGRWRTCEVAALALGRARLARQPVRADRDRRHRGAGRAARRSDRRRSHLERRVGRSLVPHRIVIGVERPRARRDRHRQTAHHAQATRRRRPPRR